jgi:hypothetical protein
MKLACAVNAKALLPLLCEIFKSRPGSLILQAVTRSDSTTCVDGVPDLREIDSHSVGPVPTPRVAQSLIGGVPNGGRLLTSLLL